MPGARPVPPGEAGVHAFLDIGTNSVRMVVARFELDHTYVVLGQDKETVRLGEDEFVDGRLHPAAMRRAVDVCARFADAARARGVDEIVAVATSATREARNGREFVRRLRAEAGLDVRTISGLEEARLIHLGVSSGLHLGQRRALLIDIGGGSTELIVGDQYRHYALDSLKLGAIRLTSRFFAPGETDPVSKARYAELQRFVRQASARTLSVLRAARFEATVAGSGTAENLADVAYRAWLGRPRARDDLLTLEQLQQVSRLLRALPLAERRRVPGLNAERADLIVAGAAILETILTDLGVAAVQITDRGLREGLIVDYLARHQPEGVAAMTVRERSVLQLGRACRFDEAHARNVARLALALFDGTRALGLHALGATERELLAHAALLHDVGSFLSSSSHEQHAYYIVRHAELLGFDEAEIALMAATARFHRKGFPGKKHAEFRALDRAGRRALPAMAACLRLAESLDRGRAGNVADVALAMDARGGVDMALSAAQDPQLERWGVEANRDAFARAFGIELAVRWAYAEAEATDVRAPAS